MATTYMPPALIGDFDRSMTKKFQLYQSWNSEMGTLIGEKASSTPAFYDARNPPSQDPPTQAAPVWKGMPRMIVRLSNDDLLTAAKLAEQPVTWGCARPRAPCPLQLRNANRQRDRAGSWPPIPPTGRVSGVGCLS